MISAFAGGLAELVKRPLFFVPALIGMCLNAAILMLALGSYEAIFFGTIISGDVPDAPLISQPYYFAANNLTDTIIIGLALLGTIIVGTLMLFTYAKMLTAKKTGIAGGISFALSKLPQAIWLGIFTFVALFLYSVVAFLLFAASISFETWGTVAFAGFLLWLAFGAFAYLKFAFTPLFIAVEGLDLKKALAKSWKSSSGKAIPIAIFLFLAYLATGLVGGAAFALSDLASDELISLAIVVLGISLSNAYYNIVFTKYFTGAVN